MSFRFSSGTMDSMAGVFAPPKKYRPGSGGGNAKAPNVGGRMLGTTVASMFPKPASSAAASRPGAQAKHAFGGGSRDRMSGRAFMTLERTSRRVPEVMVRITGRQHGGGHVLANFTYISRLGHGAEKELGLETSEGEVVRDGREMQLLAKEWHEAEMDGDARRKGATSISMILSMPSGTDPEGLKGAALDFARDEFANRQWVASLHVDRDHPHVHITIARRDLDGRRFHPDRDDLFRWRQRFAEKLRARGIEANATPTKARGIDPTHEHIAVQKMRDKGQVPRLDMSRAERAQRLRQQGIADPVQAFLGKRQEAVRATYQRSIDELLGSRSFVDQVVAQGLQKFVATMPASEPNSTRAVRKAAFDRTVAASAPSVDARQVSADNGAERIAAAVEHLLERSRAMREKLEASKALQAPDPLAAAIERSRAMREKVEANKALRAGSDLTRANEAIRVLRKRARERRERDQDSDQQFALPLEADRPGSVPKRRWAMTAAAKAAAEQANAPTASFDKREMDEHSSIPSDPLRGPGEERVAPSKSQDSAEAKKTSHLDDVPKSTSRLDLPGAIQRYARAVIDPASTKEKGLAALPHQQTELTQAGEALDKIRYDGLRHFVTAIEQNPSLVHDAAVGNFRGTLEAMAVEAQIDSDPRLRAERFMERWWTVENERRLGDPMVAVVRREMIDGLYHDPALREELEHSAPELGLVRQQTLEEILQRVQIEMDRDRDWQQDRDGPSR
jgi:hypothetical protein